MRTLQEGRGFILDDGGGGPLSGPLPIELSHRRISYNKGVANRVASVRVGRDTEKAGKGHRESREGIF
ncbi:hypothetical protein CR513_18502, partial [Mucuna pruriens]